MGLQDRDYWRDAHRQRQRKEELDRALRGATGRSATARHVAFLVAWLMLMGVLYLAFDRFLAPPKAVVTATGDLRIPRARDGHFYIQGTVNGRPVEFLVDTGASTVVVSEELARKAGLPGGTPTVFQTANGAVHGRTVPGVPVTAGPISLSAVRVGVGLVGGKHDQALLGQNFLANFNVSLSSQEMVIRRQ